MLLLMNSRVVSQIFKKANDTGLVGGVYYAGGHDKRSVYKVQKRRKYRGNSLVVVSNLYYAILNSFMSGVMFLMLNLEKCYFFLKNMSNHPSTYMGPGRNDGYTQLGGFVDHGTQTSVSLSPPGLASSRSSYVSVNERTPLIGRRATTHARSGVNVGVLALGVLLIGGVTIGTYLLIIQDRERITSFPFDLVYRESWNADEAIDRGEIINNSLVQNVYIMHTGGRNCHNFETCAKIVKTLQNNSISSSENRTDIPYNFLIGGDGKTYEGRGWTYKMGFNSIYLKRNVSLLIGVIGNFTLTPPNAQQIEETKSLIGESIRRNKLWKNYSVYVIQNVSVSPFDGSELLYTLEKLQHFKNVIEVT